MNELKVRIVAHTKRSIDDNINSKLPRIMVEKQAKKLIIIKNNPFSEGSASSQALIQARIVLLRALGRDA